MGGHKAAPAAASQSGTKFAGGRGWCGDSGCERTCPRMHSYHLRSSRGAQHCCQVTAESMDLPASSLKRHSARCCCCCCCCAMAALPAHFSAGPCEHQQRLPHQPHDYPAVMLQHCRHAAIAAGAAWQGRAISMLGVPPALQGLHIMIRGHREEGPQPQRWDWLEPFAQLHSLRLQVCAGCAPPGGRCGWPALHNPGRRCLRSCLPGACSLPTCHPGSAGCAPLPPPPHPHTQNNLGMQAVLPACTCMHACMHAWSAQLKRRQPAWLACCRAQPCGSCRQR